MAYIKYPSKLTQEMASKYGIDWRKQRKKTGSLANKLDMDCINRICENLKLLLPLRTAFFLEGIHGQSQGYFFKRINIEPYKWAMEQFQTAMAEGEKNILSKLNNPKITEKERRQLSWLLERAVTEDTYTPRSKSTKVITESKQVNVSMKLNNNAIKQPQLVLEAPKKGNIIDAKIIDPILPKSILENSN